jgi:hypothetical protein
MRHFREILVARNGHDLVRRVASASASRRAPALRKPWGVRSVRPASCAFSTNHFVKPARLNGWLYCVCRKVSCVAGTRSSSALSAGWINSHSRVFPPLLAWATWILPGLVCWRPMTTTSDRRWTV